MEPPTSSFVRPTKATQAIWAVLATVFAMAQFRMIMLIIGQNYSYSISAAQGVVNGMPHWRVYQSRVLGPWLVEALSGLFGDYTSAHAFYTIVTTAIAGWLILSLTYRQFGPSAALSSFLLFQALFTFLLGSKWLYAWDHLGILIFTIFTYLVIAGKGWCWFAALFSVAIFNRESALFIAMWMVLDPLVKAALDRTKPDWRMIARGLACGIIGVILINWLRDTLLVQEVGPTLFNMPLKAGLNFHNQWATNIAFLRRVTTEFSFGFEVLILVYLLAVIILAVLLARRDPRRYLALAVTQGMIVVSLFAGAILEETRVLLELLPFLVMGIWVADRKG